MKVVDEAQLAFKRPADRWACSIPGKMKRGRAG